MSTDSLPLDYDELDHALNALDRPPAAAEVHGHLLGCAAAGSLGEAEWMGRLADEASTGPLPESSRPVLAALYRQVMEQLSQDQLGLALVLPDDDVPLAERVEALAQWCQGFLSGYGLSPARAGAEVNPEVEDILRDFAAISQADVEEDTESGEKDLFELTEYVRLAAAQLCGDSRAAPGPNGSLIDGYRSVVHGSTQDDPSEDPVQGDDEPRSPTDPSQLFRRGPLH